VKPDVVLSVSHMLSGLSYRTRRRHKYIHGARPVKVFYPQIEVAGMMKSATNPELGKTFYAVYSSVLDFNQGGDG